jgi:hypothetical protein
MKTYRHQLKKCLKNGNAEVKPLKMDKVAGLEEHYFSIVWCNKLNRQCTSFNCKKNI